MVLMVKGAFMLLRLKKKSLMYGLSLPATEAASIKWKRKKRLQLEIVWP